MDKLLILSLISFAKVTHASYYEKIEAFSFDSSLGEYPLTYKTFGSSVSVASSLVLVPPASQQSGAIFLNQPIATTDFQMVIDLEILDVQDNVEKDEQQGLAMWYLHYKPKFPEQFGNDLGYMTSYNGVGIFIYKDSQDQQWKLTIKENNGMNNINFNTITSEFKPDSMGCEMSLFKQGKLKLMIQVSNSYLTVQYSIAEDKESGLTVYNQCVNEYFKEAFNYQGFWGLTASNMKYQNEKSQQINRVTNAIKLKSVEFYNMNADYYQNVQGIERRDFFTQGNRGTQIQSNGETLDSNTFLVGKLSVQDMKKSAINLIEFKRLRDQEDQREETVDMSNIQKNDSNDEMVFKIYEQVKAYNSRMLAMLIYQRELKNDLNKLEDHSVKDSEYQVLSKELEYTDHAIKEINMKVQNLQKDLNRIIDLIQNLLSSRGQNLGSIEYFMPPTVIQNLANVQKEMSKIEQQFMDINRGRLQGSTALEQFIGEYIKDYALSYQDLDIDAFSLALNKKFDIRMDQYQKKVQESTFSKNMTQTILTFLACLSVFVVWMKLRSMQKQYLF